MTNYMKILQGSSGSGKTTYIKEQTASENWPRYSMICGISEYTEDVINNNLPHLDNIQAEALCFRRAIYLVTSKAPFIIISNPNITIKDIAPYALLAKAYNYEFEIVCVDSCLQFDCPTDWYRSVITKG